MEFRTPFNSSSRKKNYEKSTKPSLTIPDQTMSIQEIMRRYASGLPIGGQKVPMYEGDEEQPDFQHMDLVDRQAFMEEAAQELQEVKQRLHDKKRDAARKRNKPIVDPEKIGDAEGVAPGDKPADSK